MPPISKERLERAARLYATNRDASAALGIHVGTFARLCRQHGIETPYERQRRRGEMYGGNGKGRIRIRPSSPGRLVCRR